MLHPSEPGPRAYIVRANVTNTPLHVSGSYAEAYGFCVAHRVNGHSLLSPPEGFETPLPVHIETPRP